MKRSLSPCQTSAISGPIFCSMPANLPGPHREGKVECGPRPRGKIGARTAAGKTGTAFTPKREEALRVSRRASFVEPEGSCLCEREKMLA